MISWLKLLINGDHARIEVALRSEHGERICEGCHNVFSGDGLLCSSCEGDLAELVMSANADQINAWLREAGYDPLELGAEFEAIARRALDESPLNPKNREGE